MTQIHWTRAVNGAFNTAADWSTGVVPGAGDYAILDAPGATPYTVTVQTATTVGDIQTAANALLDLRANFSVLNGAGSVVNAGAIQVENGATLTLAGTVNNTGSIMVRGTVSPTTIQLGSSVTLTGGGPIFLNFEGAHQQILPAASGTVLTNVADRISGRGLLGGPSLTIINEAGGFLEAKAGTLIIDTGAHTIVNAGLIDAEGFPGDDGTVPPAQGEVKSPVNNSGIVEVDGIGATMTFDAAVTGTGRAVLAGGLLRFNSAFNQEADFEQPQS
ncbi:MAG: hypothetical protein ACR2FH_04670, partial [Caulobacteraceae bacterium]